MRTRFAALLATTAVSGTGSRMTGVALPWFVFATTGSATRMGVVAFAEMTPYVLAKALGGPLIDRLGPRRVSVCADAVAMVAVAAVPFLYSSHHLDFGALLALVAVAGLAMSMENTAKEVLLPAVVGGTPDERAAGLAEGANRLSSLIGAPVGAGLIVVLHGASPVLYVDAATFLFAAVVIAALVPAPAAEHRDEGYLASLRTGFSWLWGNPLIRAIALMILLTNLIDQALATVLLPLWSRERIHSAAGVGLIAGATALAATLGTVGMAAIGPKLPRRRTFAVCFLLGGAPRLAILAGTASLPWAAALVFLTSLGVGGINPLLAAAFFERIPKHLLARVLGTITAIAWAGIPLGGLVGAAAVNGLGLTGALLAGAALYLVATLWPFLGRSWRAFDRAEPVTELLDTA
ncbi:MAG: MFS transporter [Mycobacteriales bacterium]